MCFTSELHSYYITLHYCTTVLVSYAPGSSRFACDVRAGASASTCCASWRASTRCTRANACAHSRRGPSCSSCASTCCICSTAALSHLLRHFLLLLLPLPTRRPRHLHRHHHHNLRRRSRSRARRCSRTCSRCRCPRPAPACASPRSTDTWSPCARVRIL